MKRSSIRSIVLSSLFAVAPAVAQPTKPVCASDSDYSATCSTPVPDCSLPANASNTACRGMEEVLPDYAGAKCTANDTSVVLVGLGVQQDGCVNPSDNVEVFLRASLTANANSRYDVSWFIPLTTSGTGRTGLSQTGYLYPVASTATYGFGVSPYSDGDGDLCGELVASDVTTFYDYPFPVRLPCERVSGGFLSIPRCVVWDQSSGKVCSDIFGTGTDNAHNSKCNCSGSSATDIPGPNVRKTCDNFTIPSGLGDNNQLDIGETATFSINYTNTVSGCTPGAPTVDDPFGRFRCGTSSFVRMVIEYGTADARGDFFVNNGGLDLPIPTCPSTEVVDTDPGVGTNLGVICNDTDAERLIFAPRDPNTSNTYTVLSAFTGTQTLSIKYTLLNNTPATPVSLTSRIFWDNEVDTTSTDGVITTAEAVDLTGAIQQTCADCSCSTAVQATPVTLSSFQATPAGRGMHFEWSTETEVGNVGFDLYALVEGERHKLNDEPIPTAGGDSLEPQTYETYLPVPDGAEEFLIEDLDLTGKARAHGPFQPGKRYGETVTTEPIEWASIRREHGLGKQDSPRQNARSVGRSQRPTGARAAKSAGSQSTIELLIDQDGLYRVTADQLLAAGFDLSAQMGSGLALSAGGKAVPIYVSTTGKFGPGAFFEFWGSALDTLYTSTNVYRLNVGQKKPARVSTSTISATGAAESVYLENRRFERNLGYAFWSPAGDPFYDLEMLVFSTPKTYNRAFAIDNYVPGAGPATLRVELYGGSSYSHIELDHHVELSINGVLIGEARFDGMTGHVFEKEIPNGVLVEGGNTLTFRQPGVAGAAYDLISLDGFEVRYPRQFHAKSGALAFSAAGSRFDVSGLSAPNAIGYRKSGDAVTRFNNLVVEMDGSGYRASLPGSTGVAQYIVAGTDALLSPSAIQSARVSADLMSGSASYLIVSHAAFLDSMAPLIAARSTQGYTVKAVDVEDIYAQFGHGVFDAAAIRDYVAYAFKNLGTRYVLLVGGDSYDYRDYLGQAPVNFIPSLYRATGEIVRWAPSDSAYADVDGDGLQDLAIGRMPVRTLSELDNVLTKTLQYAERTYSGKAIFAADYADTNANESFAFASDRLISSLSQDWQVQRIYLDQTLLATARTQLFSEIAAGTGLTSYTGHSGLTSWGSSLKPVSQHLFKIQDVATLTNDGRPTVVSQLGCWNTYYASPRTESLGARLLLTANKGAAAVLGAATLTEDANGNLFGALLTPRLVAPGATVGDAIWQAKRDLVARSSAAADLRDILLGWILLGDPALQVAP